MKKFVNAVVWSALTILLVQDASAIPSWARRYGMTCQGCHYRINRMNQTGLNMYRMGMRTAHKDAATENFGDYLNVMGQVDARGNKDNKAPVSGALFRVYAGGALSENFSFLTEATLSPQGEQELADIYAQYSSKGDNFVTVRFGQFLPLLMVDNPVEIAADRGAPFPRERRYGVEVGASNKDKLWGSVCALQSSDPNGVGKADLYDVVLNGQYIANDQGTSLGAYAWLGRYHRSALNLDLRDDYKRFGVIGNYNTTKWLFSGGFGVGEGSSADGGTAKTNGFYGNIDWVVSETIVPVINYTRYDPNTDADKDQLNIITASFFWWVAPNVTLRPQIVYTKGENIDTYRYAVRAQFIY